jgi:hypothetical protein
VRSGPVAHAGYPLVYSCTLSGAPVLPPIHFPSKSSPGSHDPPGVWRRVPSIHFPSGQEIDGKTMTARMHADGRAFRGNGKETDWGGVRHRDATSSDRGRCPARVLPEFGGLFSSVHNCGWVRRGRLQACRRPEFGRPREWRPRILVGARGAVRATQRPDPIRPGRTTRRWAPGRTLPAEIGGRGFPPEANRAGPTRSDPGRSTGRSDDRAGIAGYCSLAAAQLGPVASPSARRDAGRLKALGGRVRVGR